MPYLFISTFPFFRNDPEAKNRLFAHPEVQVLLNPHNRKLSPSEVLELAKEARSIVAGTEDLTELIRTSSKLGHISRVGIGLDSVPLHLCRSKGIRVSYTPDAVTKAVSELTIGLMLSITRSVAKADREMRLGEWNRHYGPRLEDLTIGIVGLGRIGKDVARLLVPFHPKLIFYDIQDKTTEIEAIQKCGGNISSRSFKEVISQSEILSLHVPAYSKTRHMLDETSLSSMKKGAFLINTARGDLVEEKALHQSLKSGHLAGAALDVFASEPYKGELSELDNVLLTQHMGSCSLDCRKRMEEEAVEESLRFLRGEPLQREVPEHEYLYQDL